MSRHNEMPPVPPANRSHKGNGDNAEVSKDMAKTKAEVNTAEQGDTAISNRTPRMPVSSRDGE